MPIGRRAVRGLLVAIGLAALVGVSLAAAPPGETESPEAGVPSVDKQQNVRVVSSEHEVHFADRIDFTMTAQSDSPITAVTFYYRLGGRPISVYGYPDFEPGNSVTARFSIDSGRSAYIPSGVEVEYHYVIEDASGNRLESESYSLLYVDPAFDWQSMTLENIEVLWHDRPADAVEAAAIQVDRRLTDVRQVFGLERAPVMRAVILNDRREATRSFPPISSAATDSHLYAGFAYGEFDLFVLVGTGVEGMVHEMTHLLLDEAIASPLGRVPAWYNEGLAMYFESGTSRTDPAVLSAARSGSLLPLTRMRGQPGRPSDVRLFYAQARSLVRYLVDAYGEDRVTDVVTSLSRGDRFEDAVQSAYGRPVAVLDEEWRISIGAAPAVLTEPTNQAEPQDNQQPPFEPVPVSDGFERSFQADPGTFGTSLLLALAFTFAATVAGGGWLLRRHKTVPTPEGAEPVGFDPRYDSPP